MMKKNECSQTVYCEAKENINLVGYEREEEYEVKSKSDKSYLIKDTTTEEREKMVRESITISMLDSEAPSKDALELYQKYIDGELEIDEVTEKIIENYRKI